MCNGCHVEQVRLEHYWTWWNQRFGVIWLMSCSLCSTQVPVLRVRARLWPLLDPAWRNSAALHSLSVTAVEPATTTPTPTASGSPPSKTMRCLRKPESLKLRRCIALVLLLLPLEDIVLALMVGLVRLRHEERWLDRIRVRLSVKTNQSQTKMDHTNVSFDS